jgi:glutaconate CoA-transferase subunit B
VTTVGHGRGPGSRAELGLSGGGPSAVVTDLGILEPDPATLELTLVALSPGASVDQVRDATGWELRVAPELATIPVPTDEELATLRRLQRPT